MSHTLSSTPSVRAFGEIAGKITRAAGQPQRERGPDRAVRRGCIDENEAAAKPWPRNRFGSVHERIATTESLVAVAKELQAEHSAAFPRGRVLDLEHRRAIFAAELAELARRPEAERPIGRPAALRIELGAVDAQLEEHAIGITRTDVDVLEAMFHFLCVANTGRWFPAWEAIAKAARCCVKSVGRALKRLRHHGLLSWISRSRKQAPPEANGREQRGQTSHAYFLDLRKAMAERVYQRFLQLRGKRHARMVKGKADPTPTAALAPRPAPADKHVAASRQAIESLGVALDAREGHAG